MMESAHSSMPAIESFDDPFTTSSDAASISQPNESETPSNDASAQENALEEDADPWAVLAAAAGEPHRGQPLQPDRPTQTFAHTQGETFTMPQPTTHQNGTIPIEGLAVLGSQIQSTATNLTRTLSTRIQEVDAKHGISQKVGEVKQNVEEKYHISEKLNDFHQKVVKPAGGGVVEKVVPAVNHGWGAVRRSVASLNERRTHADGTSAEGAQVAPTSDSNNGAHIRQRWASLSQAVGNTWTSAAKAAGDSVEHWTEGHMQWREEQKRKMEQESGNGHPSLDVAKERIAGGMNWVSDRLMNKSQPVVSRSPVNQNQSVVSTLLDLEAENTDSDGLPSSFFKD